MVVANTPSRLIAARSEGKIPSTLVVLEEAYLFCLSDDTEILTEYGWKKYNEIAAGDLAFSYDVDTGKLELNPIEKVIVKHHEGQIYHLYNEDSIDALVTGDHRVLCRIRTTNAVNRTGFYTAKPRFVSASTLPTNFLIPVVGEPISQQEIGLDDDLIKIIGWIVTDGNRYSD